MPNRSNILLRKRAVPKRVQLPDGRIFYARYERIGKANYPKNVSVRRTYTRTIGPKRQRKRRQRGRGIKTV